MTPRELITNGPDHVLNAGRRTIAVVVQNTSDRPIQVGSHYHFAETNAALGFERDAARGMRLNIASGLAVRFEPGQQRTVELVDFAGDRIVHGFRGLENGRIDAIDQLEIDASDSLEIDASDSLKIDASVKGAV